MDHMSQKGIRIVQRALPTSGGKDVVKVKLKIKVFDTHAR